jgi:hypothetical protein
MDKYAAQLGANQTTLFPLGANSASFEIQSKCWIQVATNYSFLKGGWLANHNRIYVERTTLPVWEQYEQDFNKA